jgi:hypothetical protein
MIGAVALRRVAHWVFGLAVTGVLVVLVVFHAAAAVMIAVADPRSAAAERVAGYTGHARSVVLDVDAEDYRRGIGYVVHVRYAVRGEIVVTRLEWADDSPPPAAGDPVEVAFDPVTPEDAVPADPADRGVRAWSVRRHVERGGVEAVLALLVLGATLRWAPRRPERSAQRPPVPPAGRPTPG